MFGIKIKNENNNEKIGGKTEKINNIQEGKKL